MDPSDLELVRGVRSTPALFNPMNADFKFAHKKEAIWMELASYLGISTNDARRRWTCLRDRYSRELKSRRMNTKTEYGPDEFFKEMDFLRPFVRKRKERRSIVCKIKSETSWAGKLEHKKEHNDDTFDSFSNKMGSNASLAEEEINEVEEVIYQESEEEKCTTMTVVVDSQQEDDRLMCEEAFEDYQEQCSQGETPTILSPQTCELVPIEQPLQHNEPAKGANNGCNETEDDFFCKSICAYLRQLSRVHKIKAKVEMFQILQKYIEIEES